MDDGRPVGITGIATALGRAVSAALARRGISVHDLDAHPGGPLDVPVQAVVHCAGGAGIWRLDVATGRRLVTEAGDTHHLVAGVVGSDLVPLRRLRDRTAFEEVVARLPAWTVVRTTVLHDEVWEGLARLSRLPVMPVPHDTRLQPVDARSVAEVLVEAVVSGPGGRLPDMGGRYAYEARDLARSYLAAVDVRRAVVSVNLPGLAGAALRAGANLTEHRDRSGRTWNEYVDERIRMG